jgi:hypothetical protein
MRLLLRLRCLLRDFHSLDANDLGRFHTSQSGQCYYCGPVHGGQMEDWTA